jgi:RHH-type proline utilization regulon transcriptional repressor/proline dehydrogenase/delta 1-pyrroline-5-carboxylate dehydrogenase
MLGNFGIEAVACFGSDAMLKPLRVALAERKGPILPLITDHADLTRFAFERHCCIDTTASGGNAALLASL